MAYLRTSGFGFFGQQSCFGPQCPPPSEYDLVPQFFPGIDELQQFGPAEAQESNAQRINYEIRKGIETAIAQMVQIGDQSSAEEARRVYQDLMKLDGWVKSLNPPFKEAPMVPPHRTAENLVNTILADAKASQPTPPIDTGIGPAPLAPTDQIIPDEFYDTGLPEMQDDGATPMLLAIGAAGLGLVLITVLFKALRRKRPKEKEPVKSEQTAAKRKRKRRR